MPIGLLFTNDGRGSFLIACAQCDAWTRLKLLDWTADGRYLAIASERTGKGALHLLPIKDGKSAGEPVFVKFGDFELGATTAAGGLIYRSVEPGGAWAIYLAALDANFSRMVASIHLLSARTTRRTDC
jgi:hypothetical protein